jgi:glycosyltransferase involved in cell wall biosynthesis
MAPGVERMALLYDDSGYVETVQPAAGAPESAPRGLMGRQVAGKEFLDAYLTHGTWKELVALVYNQASAQSIIRLCQSHPASRSGDRSLRVIGARSFLQVFFPGAPAPVLYTPVPPDPRFAWARQHAGPAAFALCGVTHTLCTMAGAQVLCEMVTAPYEPFDVLICTSQAVTRMVRTLTGNYADYLRDRHGGSPGLRIRLETIPLGVNPDKFRPPTPEERGVMRGQLQIADDEVVLLFVGRFAVHAKAHPLPMFLAAAEAGRISGRRIHLLLAGWGHPNMTRAMMEDAATFAPNVRISLVDGTRPEYRHAVWHAADVFTSLVDNIQETFGLVVIEAMACGLPVVVSDWDGYRDLVVEGETGYRVPTQMMYGATRDTTTNLLVEAIPYDEFLGEVNQTVSVDIAAAATAYARLAANAPLRATLGTAGRQRVLDQFTWAGVIRSYEALWLSQEEDRRTWAARAPQPYRGPARYPPPEETFAGYPTILLRDTDMVQRVPNMEQWLEMLVNRPLTTYANHPRVKEAALLRALLAAASSPRSVADLESVLTGMAVPPADCRPTLAWLLKYGLLRVP